MTVDLSSYKVASNELSSSTKFDNFVQAVQDALNTIPISQLAGYPSDAAKYLRGDGAWAGTFSSWTPSKITQDASDVTAIAHTVNRGAFIQIGKLVVVALKVTFTAAGTSGQPISVQGLPVTATSPGLAGSCFYNDGGVFYAGVGYLNSTTLARGIVHNGGFLGGAFAVASGDSLELMLTYEAA